MMESKQRSNSQAQYLSPDQSPSLGYGSPAVPQQSGWGPPQAHRGPSHLELRNNTHYSHYPVQQHLPPSPPQNQEQAVYLNHHFSSVSHSEAHTPLSPPASEHGYMSPQNHSSHEFPEEKPNINNLESTNIWVPSAADQPMALPNGAPGSPQSEFIEDILRAQNAELHQQPTSYQGPSNYDMESNMSTSPIPDNRRRATSYNSGASAFPNTAASRSVSCPTKTRKRRQFTGKQTAIFVCKVSNCGKSFSRQYNFTQHQETHNPNRTRSHLCNVDGCNKTFVRKTDLSRHTSSVHKKVKDFFCELCSQGFARKDTLRRHVDDGCRKRTRIVARDSRNKNNAQLPAPVNPYYGAGGDGQPRALDQQQPPAGNEYYHHGQTNAVYPAHHTSSAHAAAAATAAAAGHHPAYSQVPSSSGLPPLSDALHGAQGWAR